MHEDIADKSAPIADLEEALRVRLERARDIAVEALLRERNAQGWWTGELSASALSTATAVTALTLASPEKKELIRGGIAWLIAHQNSDGGWGDTTNSISNISTTTLVWAALGLIDGRDASETQEGAAELTNALAVAERWLTRAAGSLEPDQLVHAIEARYGADKTFSIPILTMCVLCGRLGPEREAWARVRQLPFELAALPQRWFGALQLPVVSYALPALIAIGQVRHGKRPTANPLARALRDATRARTLEKLIHLQPPNGGFLEATPLTSFVTMSLAALGLQDHVVVQRGVSFLERSVRPDGSWPIDTNLSTWVTTLSVNALGSAASLAPVRDWLLRQQYRHQHPYTLAAPGGWAWTDLPGGVPDADDTAGALLALHRLGSENADVREAAIAGVEWLLGLQNRDGGVPTFCRGWGNLPFDRSSPDITAHAMRAWTAWRPHLSSARQHAIDRAIGRAAEFLRKNQRVDGAWIPLWFGHQRNPAEENPVYGTSRVVLALAGLEQNEITARGVKWLAAHQNSDGGWSGAKGAPSSVEETSLALEALAVGTPLRGVRGRLGETSLPAEDSPAARKSIEHGVAWLCDAIEEERWRSPTPIGFYFAKLWYHERLYPLIFATAALTRLTRGFAGASRFESAIDPPRRAT
jgi:squalene-hopene/tetraprenyl-beta-curcumene cyclase